MYHCCWLTHWDMAPHHVWKEKRGRRGVTHLGGWWQADASLQFEWPGTLSTCQVIAVTCCPFSWWHGIAWLSLLLASVVLVHSVKRQWWKVAVVGHGVNRVWFSCCWLPHHWCGPCLLCEERRGCRGGIKLLTWTNVDGDDDCVVDMCCTGMNVKVWNTWNKDQVPQEKPWKPNTHTHTLHTHYHNLSARVRGLWYWKISLVS